MKAGAGPASSPPWLRGPCFRCQRAAARGHAALSWVALRDIVFFTFALGEACEEGGGRVYSSTLRSGLFSLSEQEQTSPWSQLLQACKQKAHFCGKPKMVLCSSGKFFWLAFFPAANCASCINLRFKGLSRRNAAAVHQAELGASAGLAPTAGRPRGTSVRPLGGSARATRQCCGDERGSLGWRGGNSELQVPRRGCCSRCFFSWELLRACLQLQRLLVRLDSSPERLCLQETPTELKMVTAYKRDLKGCGGCCASAEPRDPCAAFETKGKKGQSKRQVHR